MVNVPTDKKLYRRVVQEAKDRFLVWPSAYASGWVVRTYKHRGGTYQGDKKKEEERPLERWFREEWVDVCWYLQTGKARPCGRETAAWKDYPYCRPLKRKGKDTPETLQEIIRRQGGEAALREACRHKKKNPTDRVIRK